MSNRATKGILRAGSVAVDSSGGYLYDQDRAARKIKVIPFINTSTCEQDTTFDLPADGILHDVWVKITTASSAGGKISVGLLSSESGGNASGFLASVGASSTGEVRGIYTTSTSGANGAFLVSNTRGSLLATFTSGSTGTAALGDCGLYAEKKHLFSSVAAKSVSWFSNSSGVALAGRIYLDYVEV